MTRIDIKFVIIKLFLITALLSFSNGYANDDSTFE